MAGLGRKVFTRERATIADVNGYLMDQVVMVFASASARSAAIPSPSEGMVTYLKDVNRIDAHDGTTWQPIAYTATQFQADTKSGTTDVNGWLTFPHVLGVAPRTVVVATGGGPVQHVAKLVVAAKSSTQISVITYNSSTGAVLGNNPSVIEWVAYR